MNKPIQSPFVYVASQHGAEPVLKSIFCDPAAPFRLAYSQKGFVTFKSNFPTPAWSTALPDHPLVRSHGHVLGKYEGTDSEVLFDSVFSDYPDLDWEYLHVWQRDIAQPGWNGFEPGRSALAEFLAERLRQRLAAAGDARETHVQQTPPLGSKLLEIIVDEPNRWWVATRTAQRIEECWPGGVPPIHHPEDMISRAYLKLQEAILWSQFPIRPGDRVVEIGSSPGGACQCLLDLGARVTGVDPAEMDPRVASHPLFTHIRARSVQVKRKEFAPFRYLVCDANVAPNYTLDTIEGIVTYPACSSIKGLLLTMKLSSWEQSAEIQNHCDRVRSWGFPRVDARQLAHNRREYCIAAHR